MRVKKLPKILALHLKRFKYMEHLHRYTKLSYRVVFPLELRLFNTVSTKNFAMSVEYIIAYGYVKELNRGPHVKESSSRQVKYTFLFYFFIFQLFYWVFYKNTDTYDKTLTTYKNKYTWQTEPQIYNNISTICKRPKRPN